MSCYVSTYNKKDITSLEFIFLNSIIAGAIYSLIAFLKYAENLIFSIFDNNRMCDIIDRFVLFFKSLI